MRLACTHVTRMSSDTTGDAWKAKQATGSRTTRCTARVNHHVNHAEDESGRISGGPRNVVAMITAN